MAHPPPPAAAHNQSSTLLPAVATAQHERFFAFLSPQAAYFISGGFAGAVSRTIVSPLERLKIIQQIQPPSADNQYKGVWNSLVRMWREEGPKGLLRGNGINCLRIVPYSAVQFTTYEQLKKFFTHNGEKQLDTPTRLLSGALAGITSVCSTYPLDLVRSRLSIVTASVVVPSPPSTVSAVTAIQPSPTLSSPLSKPAFASAYHTSSTPTMTLGESSHSRLSMWGMMGKIVREEGGFRALYRGLPATAFGIAPYVGINFAAYETLRGIITPPEKTTVVRKLACGALAGSISQSITYPMDVLRRKMQVTGMNNLGVKYNSALEALFVILKQEGPRGLYKGLWPNLLKVVPSISISFFSYEMAKEFLLAY